jgi:hypothetical protein
LDTATSTTRVGEPYALSIEGCDQSEDRRLVLNAPKLALKLASAAAEAILPYKCA